MIAIEVSIPQIKELREAIQGVKTNINREIAAAVNATARKVRTQAARALKQELTVPVRILKKAITSKSKATKDRPTAIVRLWNGYPIPLKYFKAKQTKKSGVTYKINPKHGRRSIMRDAFIVTKYGGAVVKRVSKERGPLEVQYGPSPGTAFERGNVLKVARATAEAELPKEMKRRIRLVLLRAAGKLPQNRGR